MSILAIDLGDVWVGTALSDPLFITAQPYQTVRLTELESFLDTLFATQTITAIVVGDPVSCKGTLTEQTKKVHTYFSFLSDTYAGYQWHLWDERLSSKRAQLQMSSKKKHRKRSTIGQQEHSVAAAFILQGFLEKNYPS